MTRPSLEKPDEMDIYAEGVTDGFGMGVVFGFLITLGLLIWVRRRD